MHPYNVGEIQVGDEEVIQGQELCEQLRSYFIYKYDQGKAVQADPGLKAPGFRFGY